MASTTSVHLVISSTLDQAAESMHRIMNDVQAAGFTESAQFAIRLALDEAITNAVRHGNRLNPELKVTIDYRIDDELFLITVQDQGPGFKPENVPDPTLEENLERPCGRGIMLMRAYMTEVDYSPTGNTVRLVKRRDCRLPQAG